MDGANADRRPLRDGDQYSDSIGLGQAADTARVGQPVEFVEPFTEPFVDPFEPEPDVEPERTATPNLRVRRRTVRRRTSAVCLACGWRTAGGWAVTRAATHAATCGPVMAFYGVLYRYGPGLAAPEPEPEWSQDHRDGPERAAVGLSTPIRPSPGMSADPSSSSDPGTPVDPGETWPVEVADWDWDD